jgi:flagellin-like protein
MNTIRKLKKNAKALSPVVASIILVAVTVAVSIAVAVWMGALSTGFMQTEQLQITNVQFATGATSQNITVSVTNTGTSTVTITSVSVTPTPTETMLIDYQTGFTSASTLPANTPGTIDLSVVGTSGLYADGGSYKVTILTSKGTNFAYTAVAA